ncbi:MAG: hypothetical protein IKT37_07815 [Clostridia bacterium]|nr:hypothetical protein [Clostridia bacterium]
MKIYGKVKEIGQVDGRPYLEIEYKEFREDGTLKQTGTEDFSVKRWAAVPLRWVYTWDGQRRNKGGYRWFDLDGSYKTDDPKAFKKYITNWWNKFGIETVDVRTR